MATNTKQRAGRAAPKRTQVRPVAVPRAALDAPQPVRIITTDAVAEPELFEIFSIDDVSYFAPKDVSPSVSLRLMKTARTAGMEIALGEMLEEVLGTEAYDALANCRHVTRAQFEAVMELVRTNVMGAVELPKGSSRSA